MADSDTITGLVEPGFEAVRDAFASNFEQGREVGAAFCAHVEGRKVVDLCGGSFDRADTRPYGPESLQLVFSTTKGATAICANLLAQRGLLDMDAPVSTYWPEFDQAGKGVDARAIPALPPGGRAGDRPTALPGRTPGVDAGRRGLGRTGAFLGAGHRTRVPRALLRLPRRRSSTPDHGPFTRDVLR